MQLGEQPRKPNFASLTLALIRFAFGTLAYSLIETKGYNVLITVSAVAVNYECGDCGRNDFTSLRAINAM